jgi:hypothetical protein
MRLNLGRVIVILLAPLFLFGGHHWELEVSKSKLVKAEATLLRYSCFFDDEAYGTSIKMDVEKEHDDYTLYVYKESERIIDDKRQNIFEFVIFAKRAGEIKINPKVKLRKTSRQQIENATVGRDNPVGYYQFDDTIESLPVALLHVKDISSDLVGDFSLHVSLDKRELSAYEPLHVSIKLEGVGNLDRFKPFDLKIKNCDIFKEKPEKNYRLTKEGFKGSITQKFAIVSDSDFTLPEFSLRVYDIKTAKETYLRYESKSLHVKPAYKKEELLDKPEKDNIFSWTWLYYTLTLISGIVLGWYAHIYILRIHTKKRDIFKPKDVKTLLTHLALKGGYEELIEKAENEKWSMKQIQNALESL